MLNPHKTLVDFLSRTRPADASIPTAGKIRAGTFVIIYAVLEFGNQKPVEKRQGAASTSNTIHGKKHIHMRM